MMGLKKQLNAVCPPEVLKAAVEPRRNAASKVVPLASGKCGRWCGRLRELLQTTLHVLTVALLGIIAYQLYIITPKVLEVASVVRAHEPELEYASNVVALFRNASDNLQLLQGSFPRLVTSMLVSDWGGTAEKMTRFMKGASEATRAKVPARFAHPHKKSEPFPRWSTKPCFDKCARTEGHFGHRHFTPDCPASHPVARLSESNSGCCAFWTGKCLTCCVSDDVHEPFTAGRWRPLQFERDRGVSKFADKVHPEAITNNTDRAPIGQDAAPNPAQVSQRALAEDGCEEHADCSMGSYCANSTTQPGLPSHACQACTMVRPGYCPSYLPYLPIGGTGPDACCTDAFKAQCGDRYQCNLRPPGFLDDVATTSSVIASVAVKLMDLSPLRAKTEQFSPTVGARSEGLLGELFEGEDGGLAFGFLSTITKFAKEQFVAEEWKTMAAACETLTGKLDEVDWKGFYYCRAEENGCAYDFNDAMSEDILPEIAEACRSISNLDVLPDSETPSECNINLDAVCGVARSESADACGECFELYEEDLSRRGCTASDATQFCNGVLYQCAAGECIESENGTGVPLETCEQFCFMP